RRDDQRRQRQIEKSQEPIVRLGRALEPVRYAGCAAAHGDPIFSRAFETLADDCSVAADVGPPAALPPPDAGRRIKVNLTGTGHNADPPSPLSISSICVGRWRDL
ncbi:unnamed protein product, partial [Nesidiocoris tenuis]